LRPLKIAAASLLGFTVTFGAIVLYSVPSWHRSDCSGEECLGNYLASVSFALLGGFTIGLGAGVVTWLVVRRRWEE
jgi:hypothetical protein